MARSKKEMVKAGKIEDTRIFKLMYLEKSITEAKLLSELKKRAYNDQIENLKTERQSIMRGFELRAKELTAQVASIRGAFEADYDIKLPEWGYDDVTGVLVPANPEVLQRIHERIALQKELDAARSETKKTRTRRKRAVKSNRWENSQPDADNEADADTETDTSPEVEKPPAAIAEA